MADVPVAVVGGGVVGAAVAYTLADRGVDCLLLEAEEQLGTRASGTNSGILHTGFDSPPGELETKLILRSAELRPAVLEELGVPVVRCGALLAPQSDLERLEIEVIAQHAHDNGVHVEHHGDGRLDVPGESVTDPVAYTRGLAAAAQARGAEVRTGARVVAIHSENGALALAVASGDGVTCDVAVNCAGLYADEVAHMVGDTTFSVYPRKGEFFVFDPPEPLEKILLPVPDKRTKGVLVFPRIDGRVAAGPTAYDQEDKDDWSVRPEAQAEVMDKAIAMWPPLDGAELVTSYAGLRPAGRNGANYVIGPSPACAQLINVAAIRSTGLTASLGIGEYVSELIG